MGHRIASFTFCGRELRDRPRYELGNALLSQAQGQYAEAEPLYQRALAIYEQALRPDHSFTVATLKNYASLLQKMQRTREAAILEQRASVIQKPAVRNGLQ
jgi:tetratricopeptide (TPR) repeat protein